MSKAEQKDRKDLESAISSLYDLFPSPETRYGCRDLKTKEIIALKKKVDEREEELKEEMDKDAKLVKLKKELSDLRCSTANDASRLHRRVDELMRRLRVRGDTEELRRDVEKLAATKPVITDECYCEED